MYFPPWAMTGENGRRYNPQLYRKRYEKAPM